MKQQVNLFQPIFRRQRKVFSARAMVAVLGLVALGLALIAGYGHWHTRNLEAERAELETALTERAERVAELERRLETRRDGPDPEARVQALERELAAKQRVLATLSEAELGETEGFSPYLTGLARQRIDGVWLTGLEIGRGGGRLGIRGNTLKPELVPRYLKQLTDEEAFAGRRFRTLIMDRDDAAQNHVSFALHTSRELP